MPQYTTVYPSGVDFAAIVGASVFLAMRRAYSLRSIAAIE